jgi:hypothetical protein
MTKYFTPINNIIENKIFLIRGQKTMLDKDLAGLYGVTTSALIQAVKRNIQRFPRDFMCHLTPQEFISLKSHFVISKGRGGTRKLPYAFTEHGILMLSSVLNSEKAVQVNIQIMRTFTKLRELMLVHKDLRIKIEELEKDYDSQFKIIFDTLKQLINPQQKSKNPIGFHVK